MSSYILYYNLYKIRGENKRKDEYINNEVQETSFPNTEYLDLPPPPQTLRYLNDWPWKDYSTFYVKRL